MADLTAIQYTVLETLSIQSDGYLTSPEASAFVAVGLDDSQQVNDALVGLQDMGLVEFYIENEHIDVILVEKDADGNPLHDANGSIIPILDDENNVQLETIVQPADSGWVLTEKGREAIS